MSVILLDLSNKIFKFDGRLVGIRNKLFLFKLSVVKISKRPNASSSMSVI